MKDFEIQTFIDDRDKREYRAIKVGKLMVMSQNLACTTFQNGDPIPVAKDALHWQKAGSLSKAIMCHYAYDPSLNAILGPHYNGYALKDPRGIVPENWRLPTENDKNYIVEQMIKANRKFTNKISVKYFDDMAYETIDEPYKTDVASALKGHLDFSEVGLGKDSSIEMWNESADYHKNPFNFSALPAGYCDKNGVFHEFGSCAAWWAEPDDGKYQMYSIRRKSKGLSFYKKNDPEFGFSIRCIKDL